MYIEIARWSCFVCRGRPRRLGADAAVGSIAAGGKDVATLGGARFRAGTVATGGLAIDSDESRGICGVGDRRWTFGSRSAKGAL